MATLKGDGAAIFIVLVGMLIAIPFLSQIANDATGTTETSSVTNATITVPAANATLELEGRTLLSTPTPIISNETVTIGDGNFTLESRIIGGSQTVAITTLDPGVLTTGTLVNLTYSFEPDDYLPGAADRSLMLLVILIMALAALIFVIVAFIKKGSVGKLMKMR